MSSIKTLSDIIVYNKYAKYIPELQRRETWEEIVDRYTNMMTTKYPMLTSEIHKNRLAILDNKVLMSMRAAQFAGPAIEKNHSRIYNCAFLPIDHYKSFSETMFLLLGGTGVGFSVQNSQVGKLPEIRRPKKSQRFVIEDSIEGWADAVKHLMKAYFGLRETKPRFDFTAIRAKGERLVTAGGRAPGPEPLKKALFEIELLLETIPEGGKLRPIQVHDIICHIADAVLAGGIRRAALISLFSADDVEMMEAKSGAWWEKNSQRGRANNSAVLMRHKITKKFFMSLWKRVEASNAGEPGIYFSNDKELGTNPCAEISLRPYSFCNLTEINGGTITSQEDLNKRARVATFFGTLQAGFTDFHYLRPIWQKTTEKDSLIGVGITGIGNGVILKYSLEEATKGVIEENKRIAKIIGIKEAARKTTIKPSGTTSLLLGVSSGIHAWHSDYYIRNIQCAVGDALYNYFVQYHPKLIKVMELDHSSAVIGIPMKSPETAILRDQETALTLLERVKKFNLEWVKEGHKEGSNTNNVSATISILPEEWEVVGEWMWQNRETFNGLSCLPADGGSYLDAPFQACTKEEYKKRLKYVHGIDLTKIKEFDDNTTLSQELACAGNACEIHL